MDLFKEDNVVNKIMYHIELFAVDTEHNLNSNLAILKDLKMRRVHYLYMYNIYVTYMYIVHVCNMCMHTCTSAR